MSLLYLQMLQVHHIAKPCGKKNRILALKWVFWCFVGILLVATVVSPSGCVEGVAINNYITSCHKVRHADLLNTWLSNILTKDEWIDIWVKHVFWMKDGLFLSAAPLYKSLSGVWYIEIVWCLDCSGCFSVMYPLPLYSFALKPCFSFLSSFYFTSCPCSAILLLFLTPWSLFPLRLAACHAGDWGIKAYFTVVLTVTCPG